jgi:hypothetical protein
VRHACYLRTAGRLLVRFRVPWKSNRFRRSAGRAGRSWPSGTTARPGEVGSERGTGLAAGPFLRAASRTGQATWHRIRLSTSPVTPGRLPPASTRKGACKSRDLRRCQRTCAHSLT